MRNMMESMSSQSDTNSYGSVRMEKIEMEARGGERHTHETNLFNGNPKESNYTHTSARIPSFPSPPTPFTNLFPCLCLFPLFNYCLGGKPTSSLLAAPSFLSSLSSVLSSLTICHTHKHPHHPPTTTHSPTQGTTGTRAQLAAALCFDRRINLATILLSMAASSSSSAASFAQVPVNTLMDRFDGPLQQQQDRLAALLKILAAEEHRSREVFDKALRAHAPSPPDPLLASFHALLHMRTQAHATCLQALQDTVRRPWHGLCQAELPRQHVRLKKEWNQIVKTFHRRRQELDGAKRALSEVAQADAAALARALSASSTNDNENRQRRPSYGSRSDDVGKEEAKQRARCEQLTATRREAERRARSAKEKLLQAIVGRDAFVAQAGVVYRDMAKAERRATAAALQKVAAAEKAHCQARVQAAEALEEAARAAGREEGVEEEVGAWAARHKQPELTHRYHTALTVLERGWEKEQREDGDEGEAKDVYQEIDETRGLDTLLADLLGPSITHNHGGGEQHAEALQTKRSSAGAPTASSSSSSTSSFSFATLIDTPRGRAYFLRQLNALRGGGMASTCLEGGKYDELGACLTVFLDKCQAQNDVRAGQQALLMSNTFFRLSSSTESNSGRRSSTATSMTAPTREYLVACVRSHPWWQSRQLWEEALKLNVEYELRQCPQQSPWESLSSEALRGQVLRVHNLTFGQLGSLALHMHECGVAREDVRAFVHEMCKEAQLGEEQVQALMEAAATEEGNECG